MSAMMNTFQMNRKNHRNSSAAFIVNRNIIHQDIINKPTILFIHFVDALTKAITTQQTLSVNEEQELQHPSLLLIKDWLKNQHVSKFIEGIKTEVGHKSFRLMPYFNLKIIS